MTVAGQSFGVLSSLLRHGSTWLDPLHQKQKARSPATTCTDCTTALTWSLEVEFRAGPLRLGTEHSPAQNKSREVQKRAEGLEIRVAKPLFI